MGSDHLAVRCSGTPTPGEVAPHSEQDDGQGDQVWKEAWDLTTWNVAEGTRVLCSLRRDEMEQR